MARITAKSNWKIAPTTSRKNVISPDQKIHSHMSRYSRWRCRARVLSTYSTISTTRRTRDVTQSTRNRSGKLIELNATQKYSQGRCFTGSPRSARSISGAGVCHEPGYTRSVLGPDARGASVRSSESRMRFALRPYRLFAIGMDRHDVEDAGASAALGRDTGRNHGLRSRPPGAGHRPLRDRRNPRAPRPGRRRRPKHAQA